MRAILEDIRDKIATGAYRNEEHVRVSIVLRILQALGWNVWNPNEVNLEFPVVPNEDQTRIDVALFLTPIEPSVFIEVKALGKLEGVLNQVERQLRDYNRNNTALFSIVTDGQTWRFYYSQAGGEFANKCFKILNLTEHDLEDLEQSFAKFLSRTAVETGNSEREAMTYLQLSRKQRAMEDALPEAKRRALEPPFPKLPEALIQLVAEARITVSMDEAGRFIRDFRAQRPPPPPEPPRNLTQAGLLPEAEISRTIARRADHGDHIEVRWFGNAILRVLSEGGGRFSRQEVMEKIERIMRAEGMLTTYWEAREPGGLIRWKHRVDAQRFSLVTRGHLKDTNQGIWELTEKGRREAHSL
ncbi:MAG: hypothetical protein FJ388_00695 [Verrucomicrobia bacterium]|nr:hypothetical protein [Verrucomicrobiota bacterium]